MASNDFLKGFKFYLEAIQNDVINSDKEVLLKKYETEIAYYNQHKNAFKSILATKKDDQVELEAAEIIAGNKYLGKKWKLDKIAFFIEQDTIKTRDVAQLTKEEIKVIQDRITKNKQELNINNQELNNLISKDLSAINAL